MTTNDSKTLKCSLETEMDKGKWVGSPWKQCRHAWAWLWKALS